jgi:hypothetical protein
MARITKFGGLSTFGPIRSLQLENVPWEKERERARKKRKPTHQNHSSTSQPFHSHIHPLVQLKKHLHSRYYMPIRSADRPCPRNHNNKGFELPLTRQRLTGSASCLWIVLTNLVISWRMRLLGLLGLSRWWR